MSDPKPIDPIKCPSCRTVQVDAATVPGTVLNFKCRRCKQMFTFSHVGGVIGGGVAEKPSELGPPREGSK